MGCDKRVVCRCDKADFDQCPNAGCHDRLRRAVRTVESATANVAVDHKTEQRRNYENTVPLPRVAPA
jgi:hypothetical protein